MEKLLPVRSLVIFFLFFALFPPHAGGEEKPARHPNVILISIETTRADHLGCYGYKRNTSPAVDRLAGEAVLFSNMYTPRGMTWPSLTSLMTSLYPVSHGVRENGQKLGENVVSLAQVMQKNGYDTGAFLGNAEDATWRGFGRWFTSHEDADLTDQAIGWLRQSRGKSIFLWIFYFRPHAPYDPPPPYDTLFDPDYKGDINGSHEQLSDITVGRRNPSKADLKHIYALYDGCLAFVDSQIDRLLLELKALGIYEESLIIVTADHGEDLYQHNRHFYHGASVYESSLHIPFIIRVPGKSQGGKRIASIVENIDVAPTILELAGLEIPGEFEGRSLVPLLDGKSDRSKGYALSEWKDKILTLRIPGYRYIYNPAGYHPRTIPDFPRWSYFVGKEELYDLLNDPLEAKNIAEADPEKTTELNARLCEWAGFPRWCKMPGDNKGQAISPELKEKLRSLGYVQ